MNELKVFTSDGSKQKPGKVDGILLDYMGELLSGYEATILPNSRALDDEVITVDETSSELPDLTFELIQQGKWPLKTIDISIVAAKNGIELNEAHLARLLCLYFLNKPLPKAARRNLLMMLDKLMENTDLPVQSDMDTTCV